ncbi:MAG: response regulator transcription factor, partial [Pseudomonadota bacterium]
AADTVAARTVMDGLDFDLAILDIMMPGEDGFTFLETLRASNDLPVILLTARDLVDDRKEGLRLGADDYLSKPFDPEELSLRIAAILRRTANEPRPAQIKLSGLIFDPAKGDLREGDRRVHLTEAERLLMKLLAENLGEAVSRSQLAAKASNGHERSVDVQMTRLRRKVEPDPRRPVHLQTVRGVGYRLVSD